MKTKILMVCLGNICRSPLAEGVMKHLVSKIGQADFYHIDSAGTASYHIGDLPDSRSRQVALNHGHQLVHKGRQFTRDDFKNFDHILVMDKSNLANILKLAKTDEEKNKVRIITDYDPRPNHPEIVPDPYYGDINDFEAVYQQLVYCCEGFLSKQQKL
ncbi:MAG: low molecular weight protein-tyrosine-phosphatase [Bacteriovoracaceae bacterium]